MSRLRPDASDATGSFPAVPGVSRGALTFGLCTSIVAIAFESIAVATAMPVAARDLDGLSWYAWAFSLFAVGMLFSTVLAGRLSDRIGPTRPLVAGMTVFVVGLLVAGTAQTMPQLVAGRLVQGLGSGLMNTAFYVVLARVFAPAERPRVFAYISSAWVLPGFLGPPVAAWITHQLSWHWVFFAVLPLVALGAALVLPSLVRLDRSLPAATDQPTDQPTRRPAPLWAAALVAVGAASVQLAGQRLDLLALVPAALGVAALVVGLPPLMPHGFLRLRPGLPMVILTRGLLPGAFFGAEAFVPLMLVEQRQVPLVTAGLALTVGTVGWFSASWAQSQRFLHVRRDHLIVAGCLSVALGLAVVMVTALVPALWVGTVAVGWVLAGFGMGLATASTSIAVMGLSPTAEQGRNASSLNLGDALGSGLFVGVSGSVFVALRPAGNTQATFGAVFGAMFVVAVLAVLVSLRVGRLPQTAQR